jgi:hypothetical protein
MATTLYKIYKIVSPSTNSVYVGSTKEKLCRRFSNHKRSYASYLAGERANMTSFDIIKLGDSKIELIKEVDEASKDQEELNVQQATEHCVNKYNPMIYRSTKPAGNLDYEFTELELEKIQQAPTKNAKYVLRNYYRNRSRKLKEGTLRRIAKSDKIPKDSTLERYNITAQEIAEAIRRRV